MTYEQGQALIAAMEAHTAAITALSGTLTEAAGIVFLLLGTGLWFMGCQLAAHLLAAIRSRANGPSDTII